MSGYLADTSIFIAAEQQRPLGEPPAGKCRISVTTLTELLVGLHLSRGEEQRRVRETTVAKARRFVVMPYGEPVAVALAELIAAMRRRRLRASLADAIIAATALVHDLTVWTQDEDFESLAELEPKLRVHRT